MADPDQEPEIKRGSFARKKGEVVLREHEYDGIQEFDQKLPNWWLFTFYGAIAWFVIHWLIYYNSPAFRTDQELIADKVSEIQEKKEQELAAAMAQIDDQTLIDEWSTDPAKVAAGEQVYTTNCIACHGADLSSTMVVGDQTVPLPGLSLTDGEWKYGGKPLDIFKLINEGTPPDSSGHNGARMQAWGQVLTPVQIAEVTAYLIAKNPDEFSGT